MKVNGSCAHDRVVFLDRDGVINESPGAGSWVFRWDEFRFAPGALDALRRLRAHRFTVAVITNQSCVGRGLATLEDIEAINERMVASVAAAGGHIAGVYMCPHPKTADCACRKPRPGLIDQTARDLGVRPERAFLVGDAERDIEAGLARGCTTILVAPPDGAPHRETRAGHVVASLPEAVALILRSVNTTGTP
ncbi:MAG TPA: HAD family hydrolase [Planctomycetota bacterium]|nr:HAD family hydrolase [Planctomycetota bacterium]